MRVTITEMDGPVASREKQLHFATEDGLDVTVLEELFRATPAFVRAGLHSERQGQNSKTDLYWIWPVDGK